MKIDVCIIAPDLVEVISHPSWWQLCKATRRALTYRWGGLWLWCHEPAAGPDRTTVKAIERAVTFDECLHRLLDDIEAERRAAETARNYQAAAQRGEYPIR